MAIEVTPDQVANAKLLMALQKPRARTSPEWIVRLANAKPAPAPSGEAQGGTGGGDDSLMVRRTDGVTDLEMTSKARWNGLTESMRLMLMSSMFTNFSDIRMKRLSPT